MNGYTTGIIFIFFSILTIFMNISLYKPLKKLIGKNLSFKTIKRINRKKRFMKHFLTLINQISNIVRTGISIEEAFAIVARENPGPIGDELGFMLSEYKICGDFQYSMMNLCKRIKSKDLTIFTNSILISKKTGANIIEQLSNLQKTITNRSYIEEKVKALTIQGKIQGICISAIPAGLVLIISFIDPQYFTPLIQSRWGSLVIWVCASMNIIGLILMIKLSKVRY